MPKPHATPPRPPRSNAPYRPGFPQAGPSLSAPPGRNTPCPCGSGRKFKHCCAQGEAAEAAPDAASVKAALQRAEACLDAGRVGDALALCEQVLSRQPCQADALFLRATIALEGGHTAPARDDLEAAVAQRPGFAEAHYQLGLVAMMQGRLEEAVRHYSRAAEVQPRLMQAHANLGATLNRLGQALPALAAYQRALALQDAPEIKIGMAECLQRLHFQAEHAALKPLLARAIAEAWRRPEEMSGQAIAALRQEPWLQQALANPAEPTIGELEALADNTLLLRLLDSATVCDPELEQWLARARAVLLRHAVDHPAQPTDSPLLALRAALARQCFTNEYVWGLTPTEAATVEALRARCEADLASGQPPAVHPWLALASYQGLHQLGGTNAPPPAWPAAAQAVWRQQVSNPATEAEHKSRLRRLTPIVDAVSQQVQHQYEQNPYPRWQRSTLFPATRPLAHRLRMACPHAQAPAIDDRQGLDVLIAGCGTGRHAIETASSYRGARVLALDLSGASLAYAARQAADIGLRNLEFAQADILQLGTLPRRFDVIESVGVLHHLADPERGWRELLKLLRPGGLMLLGLYSEIARAPVVAARAFIEAAGLEPTPAGIRACRQAVMQGDCPDSMRALTGFGDFYGTSACRDLLFHEQEHRYTLPQLQALLDRLGLDLLGLVVEPATLQRFQAFSPPGTQPNDLQAWHRFETAHPQTFVRMYQFWVRQRG